MPYFTRESVRLFYTSQGRGPAVLLLHGYACDSHDWSFQIPFLVSLNFRVIALDQRGHGRSSVPTRSASYHLEEFVEDAVGLVEHLNVGPVILVGHSMGTVIASMIAVEHPDVVKALVLLHPIYSGVPDALPKMSQAMRADIAQAPVLAEKFFDIMYTPRTPEWLKTWHKRRVLGVDPVPLAGCVEGLTEVFGTVMGQNEASKKYMQRRKCPRFVLTTGILPTASQWEHELGVGELDRLSEIDEGTFAHMVEWEKANEMLAKWLKDTGLAKIDTQ